MTSLVLLAAATFTAEFKPAILKVKLDRTIVRPGERICATYAFANLGNGTAGRDLVVFVHPRLVGKDEGTYKMFGADFRPMLPTSRWQTKELIIETRPIRVPEYAPEGEYRVLIGFYDPDAGRIPMANDDLLFEGVRYEIARIRVTKGRTPPARPYERTFMLPACRLPAVVRPQEIITIANDDLEVQLDASAPIVWSVRDRRTGERIGGSPLGFLPEIEICDKADGWRYRRISEPQVTLTWELRLDQNTATYAGEVKNNGEAAAAVDLQFRLDGPDLVVSFANVRERKGYDLMQIELRELCAVGEQAGGHLVIPSDSGRDVAVGDAGAQAREIAVNWMDILHTAALYRRGGKTAVVCKPLGYEDHILAQVMPPCEDIGKYAALGVRLVHRLKAKPPATQFIAQESSGVRFTFVRDVDGDGVADWVDCAKHLRKCITCSPDRLYCEGTTYKIGCDVRPHHLVTTFDDALDLIRRVHNLTDGMQQIVYLVGWQHDGHDTGYPDVSVVNPRLGDYGALMRLMREAERLNAIVSFHDNYDDAYMDSPAWDEDVIARDNRGNLMKGGVWAGGQSYIISPLKYARKGGLERVRYTVRRYRIRRSYHIDVLSAVPQRRDYNPQSPAGVRETLQGKFMIVREFNKFGVDVTSEGVSEPFVGIMTRMRHLMRRDFEHFIGERRIPFVPFVIHGHIVYGGGQAGYGGLLGAFIHGQTYSADFNKATPDSVILDLIYLLDLPMRALAAREMQRYERDGDVERVIYDDDTFVEVDWSRKSYRVVLDGRPIARDWITMVQTKPGVMLIYSRDGGRVERPLPSALRGAPGKLSVRPLTAMGPGAEVQFQVRNGVLRFDSEARRPYRAAVVGK